MDLIVHIPDDLAERLGTAGELERRALETLALEEFKLGNLTKPELRRMLGLGRIELDGFLKKHQIWMEYDEQDLARERAALDSHTG